MPFGYHGRYLRVDLTRERVERVPLAETTLRQYLGGSGLGAWLLLREGGATVDALSPGAPLIFAFSPLVGSPLTTSAKFAVVSRSPLTERINDALAGSGFALVGKRCGGDAIVLTGAAAEPSVLVLDDGEMRLDPAGDLLGATCAETEQALRERLGPEYRVAAIGPAGERGIRYATVSHDGRHAGRGGSGAVLGSKRLKAVAIRGTQHSQWAHPQTLVALSRDLSARSFGPATAKYRELGTATNLLTFNRFGTLPTRNFQQGTFDRAEALAPESLGAAYGRTRASCVSCTIGCEHIYGIHEGTHRSDDSGTASQGVRLEYESLFALGSLCGIGDGAAVLRAVQRCDELGIDTISTGGTIAFAMECVERGLLDEPWLTFGSAPALHRAIELIGAREGLGAVLAEGTRRAAAAIGQGSESFAAHVKGLEMPGYEPRGLQTMALGLAVSSRGADHNRSGAYEADFSNRVDRRAATADSVRLAIETEDRAALMDSLILCKFLRGVFADFHAESAAMLHAVTGWDVTPDELRDTARRIVATKRHVNVLAGWTIEEDTLPARFLREPLRGDDAARLPSERLQALVVEYHRQRGW